MASLKFPSIVDTHAAFAQLLSTHVLSSAAAQGIGQAVAAGLISVEAGGPTPRSRSPARSPTATSRSRSPSLAAAAFAAATASMAARGTSSSRSVSPAASPRKYGGGGGSVASSSVAAQPQAAASSSSSTAAAAAAAPHTPASYAAYMQGAAAQMAALAAQAAAAAEEAVAAAESAQRSSINQQQQQQRPPAPPPTPASPHLAQQPRATSPGTLYQVLARTARDMQAAAAAAAGVAGGGGLSATGPLASPTTSHLSQSRAMSISGGTMRSGGGRSGMGSSSSSTAALAAAAAASSSQTSLPLTLGSPNPFRAVLSSGDFVISGQSVGVSGSGASRPKPPPRSPGGGKYDSLGTPNFTPALAGEANAPGSVYERLANPETFTGVYRRAWLGDGRMNQYSETGVSLKPSRFVGNTNTRSDETITDIRFLLRPNLLLQPGGGTSARPAFKPM